MLKSKFFLNLNQISAFTPRKINSLNSMFYFKELILRGVGYKFAVLNSTLYLRLGYSHYISVQIPAGLTAKTRKDRLVVFGHNLSLVSTFSSLIRSLRLPDSYKFKGVSFSSEPVVVKVGKQR
jgi:large subunit ribosomal protein L6